MKTFHRIVTTTRKIAVPKEWKFTYVTQQLVLVLNDSKIRDLLMHISNNK